MPGPCPDVLRICSANVTALRPNVPLLTDAELYVLQEARVQAPDADFLRARFRERGESCVFGPLSQDPREGRLLAAAVADSACTLRQYAVDAPYPGRLMHITAFAGGRTALHLFVMYGFGGGSRADRECNIALLRSAMLAAESLGRVPCFIVGDLNVELRELVVWPELALAGWTDVGHEAGADPTCLASCARLPTRRDYLLANPAAQERIVSFSVDWTTGLATHAVLRAVVRTGPPPMLLSLVRPRSLAGAARVGWEAQGPAASETVRSSWDPLWASAWQVGDVHMMWQVLEGAVVNYLRWRAAEPPRRWSHAARVVRRRAFPAAGPAGEAGSAPLDSATRRRRQLEQLERQWPAGLGARPWRAE